MSELFNVNDGRILKQTKEHSLQCFGYLREGVVIVVPSFASRDETHEEILRWIRLLVIRPISPQMSGRVDQEREVQAKAISQHSCHHVPEIRLHTACNRQLPCYTRFF